MRKSLLLFALLALVACGKEYDYFGKETDLPGSNLVDVSFNLSPDKMAIDGESTETKSQMASSADDAFNGAILFAFDHSTGKIKLDDNGAPYIKTVTTKDFSWSLPQNETMDIYTIVNYEGNVQGVDALISNKSLTVSELTQLTFTCKTVSGITNIPMSGINNNVKLTKTNNTVSIAAKRVFAKYLFAFDLSELKAAGYSVTATTLSACQSNTVVPLFYTGTGAGYRQTNAGDMATIDNATSTDLNSLSLGGTIPLYFLENCQGNKSGAAHWYDVETSGMSGLELCSYILVNVTMSKSGNQTAQSYKVFLGSDCTTNFDVVRNSSRTIRMTLHAPTAPPQVVTYRMRSAALASYTIPVGTTTTASSVKEKYINGIASGETVPASATYVSSNSTVATVNATSGVITGITPGTAVITATDSSCEAGFQSVNTAPLTVTTAPENVTWRMKSASLASYSITVGATTTATAIKEKYVNGSPTGETATATATWMSNSSTIATINYSTGVVTGQVIGTATFTATDTSCETGFQTATTPSLSVTAVPETVTWRMKSATPGSYSVAVGGTTTVTALKEKYINGLPSGETAAASPAWSTSAPAVATVGTSTGVITGVSAGTASITGTDTSCEVGYQNTPVVTITVYDDITWRMKSASLDSYSITVGGTAQASAVKEKYVNGLPSGETVSATAAWSTSNSSIATISPSGVVVGVAIGSVNFTAIDTTCESGYQSATTPTLSVAAVPEVITWRLKSASIADGSIGVGGTTVASALKEKYVNGVASGETAAATPTWVSSNTSVAAINASTGVIVGVAAGTATFSATDSSCEAGYQTATTPPLTVIYTPTVTWRLEPSTLSFSPSSISVGGTASCTTTLIKRKYEDGVATSITASPSITWSSSNTGIATVSGGTVTGISAGTASITATDTSCEAGYRSASGNINVTYTPTESWRLEPSTLTFSPSSINIGSYANCTTTLIKRKYEDGVATSVTASPSLTWSTNNSSVATVSDGTVTGIGAGTATITATDNSCEAGYRTASGNINVTYTPTETWRLEPSTLSFSPSSISVGGTASCLTTLIKRKYEDGVATSVTASPSLTWSTNASSVATVSGGTVTGIGAGTATITATDSSCEYGYRSASGNINVTYTPTETWRLEPSTLSFSPSSIEVGGTATCTTTLIKRKYEDGVATSVTASPSLTWSTNASSVATVSGGTVTGIGAGTATITATDSSCEYGYRSASGNIDVTYTPTETWRLEPLTLSFSPSSISVGGTASCTTTLVKRKYADGNPTSVTASPSLVWSTSNSSVATVSGGTVTGISAGSVTITATDNSCEASYRSASGGVTVNAVTITSIHIEDPLGYVFYNQSHHAPICYVTLSNSETYNSDDDWIYFDWDSDDVSINSQSGEFDLDGPNGNYTITCYFTKDAIAGSTTATYTITDYTYTYIGAELVQDYKTSTHVAYKIVCELKNDITNEHVYTTLYDVPVVYYNLTLTPSYESSAGGLWSASDRTVPSGCEIKGYVNGTFIGSAYAY